MERDEAAPPGGGRGRVVMIVDNHVEADSRVQKTARSAADAGWDVTLLGCGPADKVRSWRIGAAEVRVLPLAGSADGSADGSPAGGVRRRLVARGGAPLRLARRVRRPVEHAQVLFWRTVKGDRSWRWLEPGLWNYERALGPVIDKLAPDLIHAHDFRMLGVGARAAQRAKAAGRTVKLLWDAHEFLPGVSPWRDNARWLPAHQAYVREYASHADAVVTVSDTLADLMRAEYRLAERPAVVLNAPSLSALSGPVADLRAQCGVDVDTPLLVYSGVATIHRGLNTVVEALPHLADVHAALVIGDPTRPYARELLDRAGRLGVADRVHAIGFVPYRQVVPFLAAADVGLIPVHRWPNYEISLTTKFFEYSHARLPIVVSDVRTMAQTVRATGQGEVFRARDVADFVRAVRAVLADPKRYRAAYDGPDVPLAEWTWERQAEVLDSVYARLVPRVE